MDLIQNNLSVFHFEICIKHNSQNGNLIDAVTYSVNDPFYFETKEPVLAQYVILVSVSFVISRNLKVCYSFQTDGRRWIFNIY